MFNALQVKDLVILRSSLIDSRKCVTHAFSTRAGGVSPNPYDSLNLGLSVGDRAENVSKNRERFLQAIGANQERLAHGVQVHGSRVQKVENPGRFAATDGLITDKKNIVLAIKTADCVPVLLFDPERHVIAAVHAGWRSVQQRILSKTIGIMTSDYGTNPADILCAIGPAIRACCYEVQRDVADRFPSDSIVRRNGRLFLDLVKVIKTRLRKSGLSAGNIDDSEYCTCCHAELFFSYRRDGAEGGRMMMAVVLH